jgi:arylsulfatase A-like enzyme
MNLTPRALALIALLLVLLPAFSAQAQSPKLATKPNIIIILVDDMGYGDPGCYNPQSKIATPNIDRLASEGMRFTDAHAPGPLCHPSRYGLITGQHPFRTDTSKWPKQPLIKQDQTTIASLLKTAGYRTAMVGKWHLGFCFTDVMATLAEITGTKLPDDAGPDSISFLPALLGAKPENASMRNSLVIGKSIRSGPWKYIEGHESNLFMRQDSGTFPAKDEPPGQLYNLVDDLGESRNLANERAEIVIKLQAELARIQSAKRTRP